MANVMRLVYPDRDTVELPAPASTAIEVGDLLYWDDSGNTVLPAGSQSDQGTEAANQETFAGLFVGVAMGQRLSSQTSAGTITVQTRGVFSYPCPSTTWEIGDLIGASENGAGNALLDQQVEGVTTKNLAIGICTKRTTAAATTVEVQLESSWYGWLARNRQDNDEFLLGDDEIMAFGNDDDAQLLWSTGDASNHAFVMALGDSNQSVHITDVGAKATDWNVGADTHPTVYIHSNTTPATDYVTLGAHTGTAASLNVVGASTFNFAFSGTNTAILTTTEFSVIDAVNVQFGTGLDAALRWSTGDADNHSLVVALGDSNQSLHVTDLGAIATDWNIAADTNPTVYIHSNTTPATDYLQLGAHDGTTALLNVAGGTTFNMQIAGTTALGLTATTLTFADALNVVVNATTGTKFGTATTQKMGFWNATPIVQPAAAAQAAVTDNSGGSGSTVPLVGNTMAGNEAANINNAHFAIVTLLHAIRTALVNAGIMKGAA